MGLFSRRPLIVVHDRAPAKPKKPEPDLPPEPVVLEPICRDEAYLTVKGGVKWDREHLGRWERELS